MADGSEVVSSETVAGSGETKSVKIDLPDVDAKTTRYYWTVVPVGISVDDSGSFTAQHYAFLVSDDVFDAALSRIQEDDITIWADPHQHERGVINEHDGGRGFYFEDPDRHLMELITVPYGGWPTSD